MGIPAPGLIRENGHHVKQIQGESRHHLMVTQTSALGTGLAVEGRKGFTQRD
jgi:hypothetical protein